MNCSLSSSSVRGISQASILEWVTTSFSRESNLCLLLGRQILYHWANWEAPKAMLSDRIKYLDKVCIKRGLNRRDYYFCGVFFFSLLAYSLCPQKGRNPIWRLDENLSDCQMDKYMQNAPGFKREREMRLVREIKKSFEQWVESWVSPQRRLGFWQVYLGVRKLQMNVTACIKAKKQKNAVHVWRTASKFGSLHNGDSKLYFTFRGHSTHKMWSRVGNYWGEKNNT